jgi:hypothetical protein
MKYNTVTITPEDLAALSNCVVRLLRKKNNEDAQSAYRWIAYVRGELYKNWEALPNGSHLKSAYSDEVWTWNDEDLYN